MNRKIKFRAWNGKNSALQERMMYGVVINQEGRVCMPDGDWWDIPLMQFTGLHDKNGKEIYEGDVVSFSKEPKYKQKWEVRWRNGVGFSLVDGIGYRILESDNFPKCSERGEIIGNIYENPDLLTPPN